MPRGRSSPCSLLRTIFVSVSRRGDLDPDRPLPFSRRLRSACTSELISDASIEYKMGLGVLEDHHLQHVPGTALLADMLDAQHHQYHGMCSLNSACRLRVGRVLEAILTCSQDATRLH